MDLQQCFCMLDEWKQGGNDQNSQNKEFQSTHTTPEQSKRRDTSILSTEHTLFLISHCVFSDCDRKYKLFQCVVVATAFAFAHLLLHCGAKFTPESTFIRLQINY